MFTKATRDEVAPRHRGFRQHSFLGAQVGAQCYRGDTAGGAYRDLQVQLPIERSASGPGQTRLLGFRVQVGAKG